MERGNAHPFFSDAGLPSGNPAEGGFPQESEDRGLLAMTRYDSQVPKFLQDLPLGERSQIGIVLREVVTHENLHVALSCCRNSDLV